MKGQRIFSALVLVISLVLTDQSLSQTRRDRARVSPNRNTTQRMTPEQRAQRNEQRRQRLEEHIELRMQQKKRFDAEIQRTSEIRKFEALKKILKATEEQWIIIKPKLQEIDKLMSKSDVSARIITSAGAGSSGAGSSSNKGGYYKSTGGSSGSSSSGGTSSSFRSGSSGSGGSSGGGGGSSFGSGSSNSQGGYGMIYSDGEGNPFDSRESLNPLDIPADPNDDGLIDINYFWSWEKPWSRKADDKLTEGDKVCKELFELLENEDSRPEDIDRKANELSKIRLQASIKLAKARQELREAVTDRQEKLLIMTGWLD